MQKPSERINELYLEDAGKSILKRSLLDAVIRYLDEQYEARGEKQSFMGIPIEVREDVPKGKLYLVNKDYLHSNPLHQADRCKHGVHGNDCFECYPTKQAVCEHRYEANKEGHPYCTKCGKYAYGDEYKPSDNTKECEHLWNGCKQGLRCIYCGVIKTAEQPVKNPVEDLRDDIDKFRYSEKGVSLQEYLHNLGYSKKDTSRELVALNGVEVFEEVMDCLEIPNDGVKRQNIGNKITDRIIEKFGQQPKAKVLSEQELTREYNKGVYDGKNELEEIFNENIQTMGLKPTAIGWLRCKLFGHD